MDAISAFFMDNIVYVYFYYGLAFFALGLVVLLESGRASEFRFARALGPLAWFGLTHGAHEWLEMFQIFAAHGGGQASRPAVEVLRVGLLLLSFLLLLDFGARLLTDYDHAPGRSRLQVLLMGGLWLAAVGLVYWIYRPDLQDLLVAADVLARYSLAIPGSILAAWALLRERRDFHARGMSQYGEALLWAALAFVIFGVVGQLFTSPSLVFPSQTINTAFFLRTFGAPVQLLRGLAAIAITISLGSALRAFEMEGRLRLARANKARIEAQAAALEAQQRRANDVEALNTQLRATARELSAMVELSRILATTTVDLNRLLKDALYQIVHSFEHACCTVVFLIRPDGGLELAGEYRRPQAPTPIHPPPLTGVAAQAATSDTVAVAGLDGVVRALGADAFAGGRTYRTLGLPLRAKDRILGGVALSSVREEEPFGEAELNLFNAFSQQIAAAIENARLYQVVQEREVQLEGLVRQLVTAQEGERQRIARELHDETGQKLTALAMGLAAVEQQAATDPPRALVLVRNLRELSDQAITELRNIMADLRPAQLDDLGLVPALRWYLGRYQERHPGLQVSFAAERLEHRLPAQHETILFRVAQEALTNVIRHAQAGRVSMTLEQAPGVVRLEVVDDGVGFDVNAPSRHAAGSGLGLVGMRERVALVGGRCTITARPESGTRVVVELPLR